VRGEVVNPDSLFPFALDGAVSGRFASFSNQLCPEAMGTPAGGCFVSQTMQSHRPRQPYIRYGASVAWLCSSSAYPPRLWCRSRRLRSAYCIASPRRGGISVSISPWTETSCNRFERPELSCHHHEALNPRPSRGAVGASRKPDLAFTWKIAGSTDRSSDWVWGLGGA
jgi:hypothetical protein